MEGLIRMKGPAVTLGVAALGFLSSAYVCIHNQGM